MNILYYLVWTVGGIIMFVLGIIILYLIWCLIHVGEFVDLMEKDVKSNFIHDIQNDYEAPPYMKDAARRASAERLVMK